jgi:hypothetical protein
MVLPPISGLNLWILSVSVFFRSRRHKSYVCGSLRKARREGAGFWRKQYFMGLSERAGKNTAAIFCADSD